MHKQFHFRDKLECGVDEVARGVLFGRVYAGAVIWVNDSTEKEALEIKDSKALSARKRLIYYDYINENAIDSAVSYVDENEIDKINIATASIKAMHQAIHALSIIPEVLLVDGDKFRQYFSGFGQPIPHYTFPNGDATYASIAAASIIAKVEHDAYIEKMLDNYPELEIYDLANCMGYATAKHRIAIENYGPSPWHRKTFHRVKEFLGIGQWLGQKDAITIWQDEIKKY